MVVYFLTGSLS